MWQFVSKTKDVCPFYYKWAHAHFITLWGFRIVIGEPRGNTNEEKLQNWIRQQKKAQQTFQNESSNLESGSGKQ